MTASISSFGFGQTLVMFACRRCFDTHLPNVEALDGACDVNL